MRLPPLVLFDRPVTVATFNAIAPAERVRKALEKAGVPSLIRNQRTMQEWWFLAKPYAAIHLDVSAENLEKATALLSEWQDESGLLAQAIRCPACGSLRVHYPQTTRKFVMPTLLLHIIVLLGIAKHRFYCLDCQHTWQKPLRAGHLPVNFSHGGS